MAEEVGGPAACRQVLQELGVVTDLVQALPGPGRRCSDKLAGCPVHLAPLFLRRDPPLLHFHVLHSNTTDGQETNIRHKAVGDVELLQQGAALGHMAKDLVIAFPRQAELGQLVGDSEGAVQSPVLPGRPPAEHHVLAADLEAAGVLVLEHQGQEHVTALDKVSVNIRTSNEDEKKEVNNLKSVFKDKVDSSCCKCLMDRSDKLVGEVAAEGEELTAEHFRILLFLHQGQREGAGHFQICRPENREGMKVER